MKIILSHIPTNYKLPDLLHGVVRPLGRNHYLMKFAKLTAWIFTGLLLASNGGFAQEVGNPKPGKGQAHRESEIRKQAETETYEKLLGDADVLIRNGNPASAYILLEQLEFERSGEVRFDYLLGIAALDSGKPDKATLAFERVLAVNPNSSAARLDMARAYYQLGDLLGAKTEFELILKQNPPEAVRLTIQKYLDAIAAKDPSKLTHVISYVEGTVGHDSNVNNSFDKTQTSVFVIDNFYPAAISPGNLKTSDNYYGVAAGSEVVHRLNSNWGIYAGADLHQRSYLTQTAFNALGLMGHLGLMSIAEMNSFRMGVQVEEYTLGNARNRGTLGLNVDWAHKLSPTNRLNVFTQYKQYRFAQAVMAANDFNQPVIGAGLMHVLPDGKSSLSASLYSGIEADVASGGRLDGAKRFNGLRVGGLATYNDRTILFADAGAQVGVYNKTNIYYQIQRTELLYDLTLGAGWHWDKYWTIRPQLSYTQSNSNIEIYSYIRTDVSVALRCDFQ